MAEPLSKEEREEAKYARYYGIDIQDWFERFEATIVDLEGKLEQKRSELLVSKLCIKKLHEWLETVERLRQCPTCGRKGYIGLDHPIGTHVEGCDGCAIYNGDFPNA